ncbi:anthranilate synthase component 2 [Lachnospiraceae bacterium C7]|nr:anthranilate synthase component 2 [Lachnospiraceae bacterium C7]
MTILIDNFDSFSYNLYQYIGELDPNVKVIRNNEIDIEKILKSDVSRIIISPGPGRPENAGDIVDLIKKVGGKIPILGVCLGHQAICQAFGATITYAKKMMHGKESVIDIDENSLLFKGLKNKISVARYHSLAADKNTIPSELEVIAETNDGEVMAVQHRNKEIYGVQFHPESIMTTDGFNILKNFMTARRKSC